MEDRDCFQSIYREQEMEEWGVGPPASPLQRRYSSPGDRHPPPPSPLLVPKVVVTQPLEETVVTIRSLVDEDSSLEEETGSLTTRNIFKRSHSTPDSLISSSMSPCMNTSDEEFSVTLEDVAPYKYLGQRSSGGSTDTGGSELPCLGDDAWSRTDTDSQVGVWEEGEDQGDKSQTSKASWKTVRDLVKWTPFLQRYKRRYYPWVQLAGHSNSFLRGPRPGTVLKRASLHEGRCYTQLMEDTLREVVPAYYGRTKVAEQEYLELQCCLSHFSNPCIMDVKMGTRTYVESETSVHKPRKDLYLKMVSHDSEAPTPEELKLEAITKLRYLSWRDSISSTSSLGLRIEGTTMDGCSTREYKSTCTEDQVIQVLRGFIKTKWTRDLYLRRLRTIMSRCETSQFFSSHELIGSSLLFIHDTDNVGIWLIDFEKAQPVCCSLAWDNRDDGFLTGLNSALRLLSNLHLTQ